MNELAGKTCLVTGATNGIGRVSARALAKLGASLFLVARDRARADETRAEIVHEAPGADVRIILADL